MQRADHAIVVFGAAVGADGRPRPLLAARLRTALALAEADPAAVVLVSGGVVMGRPAEGPAMACWLIDSGLDPDRVVLEPNARNTVENAAMIAPLLGRLGVQRATLVTQRCHLLRAMIDTHIALWQAGLPGIQLSVAAAEDPRLSGSESALVTLGRLAVDAVSESFKIASDLLLCALPRLRRWLTLT